MCDQSEAWKANVPEHLQYLTDEKCDVETLTDEQVKELVVWVVKVGLPMLKVDNLADALKRMGVPVVDLEDPVPEGGKRVLGTYSKYCLINALNHRRDCWREFAGDSTALWQKTFAKQLAEHLATRQYFCPQCDTVVPREEVDDSQEYSGTSNWAAATIHGPHVTVCIHKGCKNKCYELPEPNEVDDLEVWKEKHREPVLGVLFPNNGQCSCGSRRYKTASVPVGVPTFGGPGRGSRVVGCYCADCTIMFGDPERFSAKRVKPTITTTQE